MKLLEIEGRYTIPDKKTILIQDASELALINTTIKNCAAGSLAYTADLSVVAILDEHGVWQQV